MAYRAHRCESCLSAPYSLCVSKCAVATTGGLFLCGGDVAERYGTHPGDDLRTHGFVGPFFAARAGLLFLALAPRWVDLSSAAVTLVGQRSDGQQMKVKSQKKMEENHEFLMFMGFIDRRRPIALWDC
jgi:hypothetical protein